MAQDSEVHLHLEKTRYKLEDSQVCVLIRQDRWFERVKEAIHVKLEKTSLHRGHQTLRHKMVELCQRPCEPVSADQGLYIAE